MNEFYLNHNALNGLQEDRVDKYLTELLELAGIARHNGFLTRFSDRLWEVSLERSSFQDYIYNPKNRDTSKPLIMAAMGNGPFYEELDVSEEIIVEPVIEKDSSPYRILNSCLMTSQQRIISLHRENILLEKNYFVSNGAKNIDISNSNGKKILEEYLNSTVSLRSIEDVFQRVEETRPKIIILDSAKKSAKLHHFQGKFDSVFKVITSLEDVELKYLMESLNDEQRKEKFYTETGYEISGESTITMQKGICRKIREFIIPEKGKRMFEWHAKIGNNIRIHYYIDLEDYKVYIGHCGKHLKT